MEKLIVVVGAFTLVAVIALLCAFPTMWLWNWLMPHIFGLVTINFWEALGINLLTGILFKNTNSSSSSK